jgi:hypothetical protein
MIHVAFIPGELPKRETALIAVLWLARSTDRVGHKQDE